MLLCEWVCVYKHECVSIMSKLQMGMQPRRWISTILPCSCSSSSSSAGGERVLSVSQLSERLTLQFLHHISYVHGRSTEVPRRSHVVPPQLCDKLGHWCWEQKRSFTTVPSGTSPLLRSPPSFSLSGFLISLQDQVQLNLKFHARTSRFPVQ